MELLPGLNSFRLITGSLCAVKKNSIRITSGPHWHDNANQLKLEAQCSEPDYYEKCGYYYAPFTQPYSNCSNVNAYLSNLDSVISYADQSGLKVMLDINVFSDDHRFTENMLPAVYEYLNIFGTHFKKDERVFSYCIFEEIGFNDPETNRSKKQVSTISAKLYDVLKSADPNHLISISGFDT